MKPELTAQILGMYVGRPCDIDIKSDHMNIDSNVITPALVGYFVLGDVDVTPHLRRLESITEEECRHCYLLDTGYKYGNLFSCKNSWWHSIEEIDETNGFAIIGKPAAWLYLLSKGFDLFGLIDAGLAEEVSE